MLQRNVYTPGSVNVCSTAAPPGSRDSFLVQLVLVDVTVCGSVAWSNSHRTVDPLGTVTSAGCQVEPAESLALIVVCACAAVAAKAQTMTASSAIHSFD